MHSSLRAGATSFRASWRADIRLGLHPRLYACVGVLVRAAVSLDASDCTRLLGLELLRQHHVPACTKLLLHNHVPRIQW